MTTLYGKFPDPQTPTARLYGNVLSSHGDLYFVEVTQRNSTPLDTPYRMIVPQKDFALGGPGANNYYWRRQLRGKDGKWIEMGGSIEWHSPDGTRHLGTVSGFDDTNQKVIVTDSKDNEYKLDADTIRKSAVKATIPQDSTDLDEPSVLTDGIHPDDLHLFDEDDNEITPEKFADFPVGKPLNIKDSQGKPVARVTKQSNDDKGGIASILIDFLTLFLPEEIYHFLASLRRNL